MTGLQKPLKGLNGLREHLTAKAAAAPPIRHCNRVTVGLSVPDDGTITALFTYNSLQNEADSVQSRVRRELPGELARQHWAHLHDVNHVSSVLAHVPKAAHSSERDAWAELEATAAHKAKAADQATQKLLVTTTMHSLDRFGSILRTSMSSVGGFFERVGSGMIAFKESHSLLPKGEAPPLQRDASKALNHSMAHYKGRKRPPKRTSEPSPRASLKRTNSVPVRSSTSVGDPWGDTRDSDERETQEVSRILRRGSTPATIMRKEESLTLALKFDANVDDDGSDIMEPTEARSRSANVRAAFLPTCACFSPRLKN